VKLKCKSISRQNAVDSVAKLPLALITVESKVMVTEKAMVGSWGCLCHMNMTELEEIHDRHRWWKGVRTDRPLEFGYFSANRETQRMLISSSGSPPIWTFLWEVNPEATIGNESFDERDEAAPSSSIDFQANLSTRPLFAIAEVRCGHCIDAA